VVRKVELKKVQIKEVLKWHVAVVNRKNGMERSDMSVSVQKVTSVESLQVINYAPT